MTLMLNREATAAHWTIHDSPRLESSVRTAAATRGEWEVVTRRIDRNAAQMDHVFTRRDEGTTGAVIALGAVGTLRIDAPFERVMAADVAGWSASGRLVLRRPWFSRVDIEIWPWSANAVELRVAPRSRRLAHCDARSQRRYFSQAHAAADALVRVLGAGSLGAGSPGPAPISG